MAQETAASTGQEGKSSHSLPGVAEVSILWGWLQTNVPWRVLWWMLIGLLTLFPIYGAIFPLKDPAIREHHYRLGAYTLKITYPEIFLRENQLRPGQSISIQAVDLPGSYRSAVLYLTIDPGSPFQMVDKEGAPIQERVQIYPLEEAKGLFLRLKDDRTAQEAIRIKGQIYQDQDQYPSARYDLVLENTSLESQRQSDSRRFKNLIFDPASALFPLVLAFITRMIDEARTHRAERKAREKEQYERWLVMLDSISAEIETAPLESLTAFLDTQGGIERANTQKRQLPPEYHEQLLNKRIRVRKKLKDQCEQLLFEAGECLRAGNRSDCVDLLEKIAQVFPPSEPTGPGTLAGGPTSPSTETRGSSLLQSLPDLVREPTSGQPAASMEKISTAFSLHHQFPWGGREIAITLLLENFDINLIVKWDSTFHRAEQQSAASLLQDDRLQKRIPEGFAIIHHSYELPSAPLPLKRDDATLAYYQSMGFYQNPFYPYFPDYDRGVFEHAETDQPCILTDPSWHRRKSAIRAIITQNAKNSARESLILPISIIPISSDLPPGIFQNLVSICRAHADLWIQVIASYPILFIDQPVARQVDLVELFLFSYGSISAVLHRLDVQGMDVRQPAGKSFVHRLKKLGDGLSQPAHLPASKQMLAWLAIRPPDLSRTLLQVSAGTAAPKKLSLREQRIVAGWASMVETLIDYQVVLKLWLPGQGSAPCLERLGLPVYPLCWEARHLMTQLKNRFERSSTGSIAKTFEALFDISPDEYFSKILIENSRGSIERMLRMGDDLVRQHVNQFGENASFITLGEMEEHIRRWENRP